MEWSKHLKDLFQHEQRGMIFGGLIGLLIGLMILFMGFWSTFFLLCCVGLGIFVGKQSEKGTEYLSSIQDLLWKRFQR